jgi:nicotinamide-nucleotide amidase
MTQNVNAEVISIGTEILLGELTDTNSVFIARTLRDLGINLYYMVSVGDNEERIANTIQNALARAQVVITCGGLGPTVDDMTRQAVATATGRDLTFHQNLLDQIAERFANFNVKMTENNRQQAYLPDDAIAIENPVGTAPCFIVEHNDGVVISLPGVPREMKFLLEQAVVPYLQKHYQLGIIKARTLKTAGIGESTLDSILGKDLLELGNPTIGLAAHSGQIDVRMTAKANDDEAADRMLADMEAKIRERAGQFIFGVDDDALECVLVSLLEQNNASLSIIQAGIGDEITKMVTSVSGGVEVVDTSRTFTHPDELRAEFSIAKDISLQDSVCQIAQSTLQQNKSAVAIVVASLPDIDENGDQVEGTAIAVCTQDKMRSRVYGFGAKSEIAREWVKSWSISAAWRMLKEDSE